MKSTTLIAILFALASSSSFALPVDVSPKSAGTLAEDGEYYYKGLIIDGNRIKLGIAPITDYDDSISTAAGNAIEALVKTFLQTEFKDSTTLENVQNLVRWARVSNNFVSAAQKFYNENFVQAPSRQPGSTVPQTNSQSGGRTAPPPSNNKYPVAKPPVTNPKVPTTEPIYQVPKVPQAGQTKPASQPVDQGLTKAEEMGFEAALKQLGETLNPDQKASLIAMIEGEKSLPSDELKGLADAVNGKVVLPPQLGNTKNAFL
ncbi:hypothetical protein FRB99_005932 [Tulasnella sp. 403]|nr:hypothetical protein FRB99_005932 [Tulasnella sp. 403]